MSDTGVGDDNRTAVSDEGDPEAAKAWDQFLHAEGWTNHAASPLARRAFFAGFAAARRDVPGGREAEAIVRRLAMLRSDRMTPSLRDARRDAKKWAASHPLERADSEATEACWACEGRGSNTHTYGPNCSERADSEKDARRRALEWAETEDHQGG